MFYFCEVCLLGVACIWEVCYLHPEVLRVVLGVLEFGLEHSDFLLQRKYHGTQHVRVHLRLKYNNRVNTFCSALYFQVFHWTMRLDCHTTKFTANIFSFWIVGVCRNKGLEWDEKTASVSFVHKLDTTVAQKHNKVEHLHFQTPRDISTISSWWTKTRLTITTIGKFHNFS